MSRPSHNATILQKLAEIARPVSAVEIQEWTKLDKSTVYRRLQSLTTSGELHRIDLGEGKSRYEIASDNHHHHVLCDKCGYIEDIHLHSEAGLLSEIMSSSKFRIKSHLLEFRGICQNCQ